MVDLIKGPVGEVIELEGKRERLHNSRYKKTMKQVREYQNKRRQGRVKENSIMDSISTGYRVGHHKR